MKKEIYKVFEHTIDENINILRCVYCNQKPHVGNGYCPNKPDCVRCNGNGCPACDGTKGSKYNPEPF